MIDQQKGTEEGASGDDLGAPFSLPALSKSALTHPPQAGDVLPPAVVRSPRGGPPGVPSLPGMDRLADATSGLCIGRSFADAPGAWGPSAANKLCRVCTGALRRLSSPVHSTPNPAASPSAALPICEKPCSWSPARSSSTLTRPIPYFSSWTKNEPFAGLQGRPCLKNTVSWSK